MVWNGPCAEVSYKVDPAGSIESYRKLLDLAGTDRQLLIVLYSGTWDSAVPFVDTLKGIKSLNSHPIYL